MARHQTGDKPWHDWTFIKCKTFNFHFNLSKFIMCVCFCQSRLSYVINSIAADVLTTQGGRWSAAMVLVRFSWNIPVSAPEELIVILHFIFNAYGSVFLYARLKNGRIMLWQCPSVCPSVRPSVRPSFPDFFSTCFEISIWNLVYAFSRWHDMSSLSFITIGSLWPSLQPKVGQTQFLQSWPYKSR